MTEEWLALTRFAAGYYIRSWGEAAVPTLPVFFRRIPGVRHQNQLEKLKKLPEPAGEAGPKPALNDEQSAAVEAVSTASGYSPFLLFGVTGSGKTEVYLHIMERVLARDPEAQVLLLVPEINLTPQLEGRVRSRFPGESVVTLNSDLADMERARSWLAVHEGAPACSLARACRSSPASASFPSSSSTRSMTSRSRRGTDFDTRPETLPSGEPTGTGFPSC